jgi:hypothetical protein
MAAVAAVASLLAEAGLKALLSSSSHLLVSESLRVKRKGHDHLMLHVLAQDGFINGMVTDSMLESHLSSFGAGLGMIK